MGVLVVVDILIVLHVCQDITLLVHSSPVLGHHEVFLSNSFSEFSFLDLFRSCLLALLQEDIIALLGLISVSLLLLLKAVALEAHLEVALAHVLLRKLSAFMGRAEHLDASMLVYFLADSLSIYKDYLHFLLLS